MSIEVIESPSDALREKRKAKAAPKVELSVVVPAYREGRRIYGNLTRLVSELDKLNVTYEVVVVSDGNTDTTVREAKRVLSPAVKVFHYPMNIGKGFALTCGVDQSVGSLVTFIDADMELDPANISGFIDLMKSSGCDAVVGSKRHPMSKVSYPKVPASPKCLVSASGPSAIQPQYQRHANRSEAFQEAGARGGSASFGDQEVRL